MFGIYIVYLYVLTHLLITLEYIIYLLNRMIIKMCYIRFEIHCAENIVKQTSDIIK